MAVINLIFQQSGDNNTVPGPREDLILGTPITVLNQNPSGITSYLWQFIDIPAGSTAVIDFPANSTVHFTPDLVGTYLIRLTVNNATVGTSAAAIKTANLHIRLPAAGEITEFGVKGWARAVEAGFKILDDGYGNVNSSLPGYALDSAVVHNSGDENINGAKTFMDSAIFSSTFFIGGDELVLSGGNNGDVLTYNASQNKWQATASSGGGTLQATYDASLGAYPSIAISNANGPFSISNGDNNTQLPFHQVFSVLQANQARIFGVADFNNGTTQVSINGGFLVNNVQIDPSGASDGQALVYSNGAGQFQPTSIVGGSIADGQIAFGNGTNITSSSNLTYSAGAQTMSLSTGILDVGTIQNNNLQRSTGANVQLFTINNSYTIEVGAALTTTQLNGNVQIDGYRIDPSFAINQQSLVYDGSKFAAAYPTQSTLATSGCSNVNFATNDHLGFNDAQYNSSDILLDTSSPYSTANGAASVGRFTLKANRQYRLVANSGGITTNDSLQGFIIYKWYNATTGFPLNGVGAGFAYTSGATNEYIPASDTASYFSPGTDTLVEVRIVVANGNIDNIGTLATSWAMIETI